MKEIVKKLKKLNNTIIAPFRAKIGGKRMRNEMENIKIIVSFNSVPTQRGIQNAKKKAKKLKNTITHHFKPK